MPEPTLLYKYLDCQGIKVLENRTFRGSIPTRLNDPFEFIPGFLPLTDEDVLNSIATEDVLIDTFWKMKKRGPMPKEEFRAYIRQQPQSILEYFHQHPNASDEFFEKFCEGRDGCRILCFSLRNDGILMWSHYADHHRGFVLGFHKAALDCDVVPEQRFPVEYRSARPCIGNLLDVMRPGESEALKMMARTKSLEWAYEEEYRFVFWKNEGDNESDFNPARLHQVIFGSHCLPKLEAQIREILAGPKYQNQHVKVSRAVLSKREFKIEIKDE